MLTRDTAGMFLQPSAIQFMSRLKGEGSVDPTPLKISSSTSLGPSCPGGRPALGRYLPSVLSGSPCCSHGSRLSFPEGLYSSLPQDPCICHFLLSGTPFLKFFPRLTLLIVEGFSSHMATSERPPRTPYLKRVPLTPVTVHYTELIHLLFMLAT